MKRDAFAFSLFVPTRRRPWVTPMDVPLRNEGIQWDPAEGGKSDRQAVVGMSPRKVTAIRYHGLHLWGSIILGLVASLSVVSSEELSEMSSQGLVIQAWGALKKGDYALVHTLTDSCIKLYAKEAEEQEGRLKDFAPAKRAFEYWALNDVGTAYFIKGEAYVSEKRYKEAKQAFKTLIRRYRFAQCWDPRGWFWKPAEEAKKKIEEVDEFVGFWSKW